MSAKKFQHGFQGAHMNAEKMTQKAMEAMEASHVEAIRKGHPELTTLHLLEALLKQEHGLVGNLLQKMGTDPAVLEERVTDELGRLPTFNGASGRVAASGGMNQVLVRSDDEAKKLGDDYVSVEHLLLAILEEGKGGSAGRLLNEQGVSPKTFLKTLEEVRGGQKVTSRNPEDTYEALEKYGADLTLLAREGKLDPVIGRDDEIRRLIQVLSRRTKNNPVLIGEPGVGKTAIAEGLAQRIARNDVPDAT